MKPSELNEQAKRQMMQPKPKPVPMGDALAGDQYARADWQERIARGDSTLSRLALAHKQYREGAHTLRDAFANPDPEVTPDAHFMNVKRLGEQSLSRAATSSDAARTFAETEVKTLRASMQSELGLVESHRAGEIRTLMRSLSDAERQKLLQAAVAEGDAQTIAAVIEAPAYLSGLNAEQAKAIRLQYEQAHAGDTLARIQVLEQAIEINRQTALEAVKFHAALLPAERAKAIADKQKAARQMREKLSIVTGA